MRTKVRVGVRAPKSRQLSFLPAPQSGSIHAECLEGQACPRTVHTLCVALGSGLCAHTAAGGSGGAGRRVCLGGNGVWTKAHASPVGCTQSFHITSRTD